MTDRPNTGGNWQINYSWTQPYSVVSHNPFYSRMQDLAVERELDLLDRIDQRVQNQLTYPDAERIINTIVKQQRGLSND